MSALTTPTKRNKREKKKKRNEQKETPTSDQKPNKGKEQDHLKKSPEMARNHLKPSECIQQAISSPNFSPLLAMHESSQKCKTFNLELLKYTKFNTGCYTCPNEQVRYSIASYRSQLHDHQVSQPLDEAKMDLRNFAKNLPLMSKVLNMTKTYRNGKATQTSC
jgi:hypothetical protein